MTGKLITLFRESEGSPRLLVYIYMYTLFIYINRTEIILLKGNPSSFSGFYIGKLASAL